MSDEHAETVHEGTFSTKRIRTSDAPASHQAIGGARRDRTDDLMLAKHALSQLSYGPRDLDAETRKRNGGPGRI